jgi:hypothetical protein
VALALTHDFKRFERLGLVTQLTRCSDGRRWCAIRDIVNLRACETLSSEHLEAVVGAFRRCSN